MSSVAFLMFLGTFSKQQHLSRKVKSSLYMPRRHMGRQRCSVTHSCVMCVIILYSTVLYCCPVVHGSTLPQDINPLAFNNNKTQEEVHLYRRIKYGSSAFQQTPTTQ